MVNLTTDEMKEYFKGRMTYRPCCANCAKWIKDHDDRKVMGQCMVNAYTITTDLTVCSKWQRKEDLTPDAA